jgi:hypothetical protein
MKVAIVPGVACFLENSVRLLNPHWRPPLHQITAKRAPETTLSPRVSSRASQAPQEAAFQ